jgi:hypothetical protein
VDPVLTDEEAAALLRELDGIIDGGRYFRSPRIKTLKGIRAKLRPEPRGRYLHRPSRYEPRLQRKDGTETQIHTPMSRQRINRK